MTTQTDPAKRLFEILDKVISYSEPFPSDTKAVVIWKDCLEIPIENLPNFLSELILIINTCERRIRQNKNISTALHLKPLTNVKNALFYSVMSGTWEEFRDLLDDGTLLALEFVSEALSKSRAEALIDAETLEALQDGVEALLEKVLETDLDEQLKTVLIDGLESIRQAILDYRIYGAEGLRQALDKNVGLLVRYREDFQQASENNGRDVIFEFSNVLRKLDILVAVGLKVKQLAEPIINLLKPGDGGS